VTNPGRVERRPQTDEIDEVALANLT